MGRATMGNQGSTSPERAAAAQSNLSPRGALLSRSIARALERTAKRAAIESLVTCQVCGNARGTWSPSSLMPVTPAKIEAA